MAWERLYEPGQIGRGEKLTPAGHPVKGVVLEQGLKGAPADPKMLGKRYHPHPSIFLARIIKARQRAAYRT